MTPGPLTPLRRTLLLAALFALAGLGLYANSLRNPFHYDDHHGIVDNYALRDLSPKASSSEADAGLREENASKQEPG